MPTAEKPKVLLVDDNEATRTLIVAILQRDFCVEVATDGMEAVDKLRTHQYAATLLDLRMPQYDGFSVLDFLTKNNPEALKSVLVVTALLTKDEIARARSYNVCGIVSKPFDIEALLAAVKQCAGMEGPLLGSVFCSPVILLLANLVQKHLI